MANFGQLLLTNLGIQEQNKAQGGTPLKFKRIGLGSGSYNGNIMALTKLVNENVSVNISKGYIQNGAYTVEGFFSNEDLQVGFAWREIGLFVETENGGEVLYCYANAGNAYDFIPATSDERYSKNIRIATAIGNATNVSIVENEGLIYVDTLTFNAAVDGLKSDVNQLWPSKVHGGEAFVVDDSANLPFLGLNIFGKSTQKSTEGNQLMDFSGGTTATGVTKSFENDILTVTGDGKLVYQSWSKDITGVISGNPGKTLYLAFESIKTTVPSDGSIVQFNIAKNDGTSTYIQLVTAGGVSNPYKVPSDVSNIKSVHLSVYATNSATAIANTVTIVKPMLQIGTEVKAYEPFTGRKPSPSPEYPQEIESVETPELAICGGNLANIKNLSVGANTSLVISDDEYTVKVVGGSNATYASSGLHLPITLIKGRTVVLKADSIVNSLDSGGKGGNVQLNIKTPTKTLYKAISDKNLKIFVEIPEDATEVMLSVYSNNSNTLFATDNVTTIKGICVSLADIPWEAYKDRQTVILPCDLYGIPVSSGGNYTDSEGQQWLCDEVDPERGVYIKRLKEIVLDGSSSFNITKNHSGENRYLYCVNALGIDTTIKGIGYCDKLRYNTSAAMNEDGANTVEKSGYSMNNSYGVLYINIGYLMTENTAEELRSILAESPYTFICALKTPIEIALTSEQIAAYKALTTYNPCTSVLSDSHAWLNAHYVTKTFEPLVKNVASKQAGGVTTGTAEYWAYGSVYGVAVLDMANKKGSFTCGGEVSVGNTQHGLIIPIFAGLSISSCTIRVGDAVHSNPEQTSFGDDGSLVIDSMAFTSGTVHHVSGEFIFE